MVYKDASNRKSNQQNLGTIKSSNLCTEIIEYSSPEETAVCNLASIALSRYVEKNGDTPTFNFNILHNVTKVDFNVFTISVNSFIYTCCMLLGRNP